MDKNCGHGLASIILKSAKYGDLTLQHNGVE